MEQSLNSHPRIIEVLTHVIGWGIVFGFPFLMMTRSGFTLTWIDYLRHGSIIPISFLIVFYINYICLIPNYLFEGRIRHYLLLNIILIICVAAGAHLWQEYAVHLFPQEDVIKRPKRPNPPKWIFIARDIFR